MGIWVGQRWQANQTVMLDSVGEVFCINLNSVCDWSGGRGTVRRQAALPPRPMQAG